MYENTAFHDLNGLPGKSEPESPFGSSVGVKVPLSPVPGVRELLASPIMLVTVDASEPTAVGNVSCTSPGFLSGLEPAFGPSSDRILLGTVFASGMLIFSPPNCFCVALIVTSPLGG